MSTSGFALLLKVAASRSVDVPRATIVNPAPKAQIAKGSLCERAYFERFVYSVVVRPYGLHTLSSKNSAHYP